MASAGILTSTRPRYWFPRPWHLIFSGLIGAVAAILPLAGRPSPRFTLSSLHGFSLFLVLTVLLLSIVMWTCAAAVFRLINAGVPIAVLAGALSPIVGGAFFGVGLLLVLGQLGDFVPLGIGTSLLVRLVAVSKRRGSSAPPTTPG